jgi:hypothetical protein
MTVIKWEYVEVTPELAGKWLGKNDVNRKLREHRAAFIARAIDEGHWVETHQAIAFARSGRLLDGQHRLRAIIMANKAVKIWVATNVPEEAYKVMDSGLPRKMHERLGSDAKRTAVASTLWRMAGPRTTPHEYEIDLLLESLDGTFRRLEGVPRYTQNGKLNKASILAAMVLRLSNEKIGSERSAWMLDAIENYLRGEIVGVPKVVVSLYRQVIDGVNSQGGESATDYFCRTWYALEPDNAETGKILIRDSAVQIGEARAVFKNVTQNLFDGG